VKTILYETKNGVFEFNLFDVEDCLKTNISEYDVEEAKEILSFLSSSSGERITIPEKYDYFGHIALDLINDNKGSVTCKICNRTYQPDELKSITVGHGETPIDENLIQEIQGLKFRDIFSKKWISAAVNNLKNLLSKKQKIPGMFGGKGYECPEGHELISRISWLT